MKNLICTLALVLGAFFTAQAQYLGAKIINNNASTWGFKVEESSAVPQNITLSPIASGNTAYGFLAGPVTLPFTCSAGDLIAGCSRTWVINGVSSGIVNVCGTTITWQCAFSPLIPQGWAITATIN